MTDPSVAVMVVPIAILPQLFTCWPTDIKIIGTAELVAQDVNEAAFYLMSPAWKGKPWPKDGTPRSVIVKRVTGPNTAGWVLELAPLPSSLVGMQHGQLQS